MAGYLMKLAALLSLVLCNLSVVGSSIPSLDIIPATPVNRSVDAQFLSLKNTLDAPHLSAINESVFEWWYLDFVTLDLSTSAVVIFFTSTANAFPLLDGVPGDLIVTATVSLSNGTSISSSGVASKAVIASHGRYGDGVNARFEDIGAFTGSPDLNQFNFEFDTSQETDGFRLSISLESVAPAHIGCSATLFPDQSLLVLPHLGWTNAVPDASATASLTLPNSLIQSFTGSGYHDHNFGDVPFPEIVSQWYWGRGRVGPYSFVFFSGADAANGSFATGYVSENGRILVSSCTGSSAIATPTNGQGGDGDLQTLAVEIPIDSETTLSVTIDVYMLIAAVPGEYYRWTGNVTGGIGDSQYVGGVGIVEHFPPPS